MRVPEKKNGFLISTAQETSTSQTSDGCRNRRYKPEFSFVEKPRSRVEGKKMEKINFEIPARIFWFSSFKKKTKQNEKIQEIAFRNRFSGAKVKEKEERLTC